MLILKKILLSCFVFFALFQFCSKATDGFSLHKIQSSHEPQIDWSTPPLQVSPFLNQSFHYLGHGAQTFAFRSEDDQYVIKFYRHHRSKHPLMRFSHILPREWRKNLKKTVLKRREKRGKDFKSYVMASRLLKEETGLIYVHLNPTTHLKGKLTLYDKVGIKHSIDPNLYSFILQKRATPFYPTLQKWIESGDVDQAKQELSKLLFLISNRCKRGLSDKDPDLTTNFGFTEIGPIQFDIGRYKKDPSKTSPAEIKIELLRITDRLCQWLEQKDPSLSAHIKEEIAKW